jgi:hypothetical protein
MKSQANTILIYGLVDTKEPTKIKYVGKTHQKINKRIHDHIRESYKLKTKKDIWIQSVLSESDNNINYVILEKCTKYNWLEREKYWINKLDGLTNTSKGGDGGRGLLATMSYEELKKFANDYMTGVTNSISWIKFVNENKQYNFLPKYPYASYKNRGWISWSDLLLNYNGSICENNLNRRDAFRPIFSYDECKNYLKSFNIKNVKDFKRIIKTLNPMVPSAPDEYYKKLNTWISWIDFLSSKNFNHKNKNFLTYEEAKLILKPLNLKSALEYKNFIKKSDFIFPFNPNRFYKNTWISWSDFLSKKR